MAKLLEEELLRHANVARFLGDDATADQCMELAHDDEARGLGLNFDGIDEETYVARVGLARTVARARRRAAERRVREEHRTRLELEGEGRERRTSWR